MKAETYRSRDSEARLRAGVRAWLDADESGQRRLQRHWTVLRVVRTVLSYAYYPVIIYLLLRSESVESLQWSLLIFCLGALIPQEGPTEYDPPDSDTLSLLPIADRSISVEALRLRRHQMLYFGGFCLLACLAIPEPGVRFAVRIAYIVSGVSGFLAAGAMWWGLQQLFGKKTGVLKTVIIIWALYYAIFGRSDVWPVLRAPIEWGSTILPWRWGMEAVRQGRLAVGYSWAVPCLAVAAVWIGYSRRCMLRDFRLDRSADDLDWAEDLGDDNELRLRDASAADAIEVGKIIRGVEKSDDMRSAVYPQAPISLPPLEKVLWRFLSPEQRWLAQIGGIEAVAFHKRLGWTSVLFAVGLAMMWVGERLRWEMVSGFGIIPVILGIAIAVPWYSTSVTRWIGLIVIGPGVGSSFCNLLPIQWASICQLRAKEILLKSAMATPLQAFGLWMIRHFDLSTTANGGSAYLSLLLPVLVAQLILLSAIFANAIVDANISIRGRGWYLKLGIQAMMLVCVALLRLVRSAYWVPRSIHLSA